VRRLRIGREIRLNAVEQNLAWQKAPEERQVRVRAGSPGPTFLIKPFGSRISKRSVQSRAIDLDSEGDDFRDGKNVARRPDHEAGHGKQCYHKS